MTEHRKADERKQQPQGILHEPLVQFLLLGGLIFLITVLRPAPVDDSGYHISVSAERIGVLRSTFEREFQREPDAAELQELIDNYVRTEVSVREARALGLDGDDSLIRDHLRAKFELTLDDGEELPEPTELELLEFMAKHPGRYTSEDALSFRQIYLDPLQRGAETELDAGLLLEQLDGSEDIGLVEVLSDPGPLPARMPLLALSEISWQFDPLFAEAIEGLPAGEWSGPLESSYGVHLVQIEERRPGRELSLAEIRREVELDWLEDLRRRKLDRAIDELLKQYEVEIAGHADRQAGGRE